MNEWLCKTSCMGPLIYVAYKWKKVVLITLLTTLHYRHIRWAMIETRRSNFNKIKNWNWNLTFMILTSTPGSVSMDLPTSGLSKVICWQTDILYVFTDRQTIQKLYTMLLRGWSVKFDDDDDDLQSVSSTVRQRFSSLATLHYYGVGTTFLN